MHYNDLRSSPKKSNVNRNQQLGKRSPCADINFKVGDIKNKCMNMNICQCYTKKLKENKKIKNHTPFFKNQSVLAISKGSSSYSDN